MPHARRLTLPALLAQENVQGPRCDQCRLGTFSLDAANPKGCTRCFCFGATERCRSSTHTRQEVPGRGSPGGPGAGGTPLPRSWVWNAGRGPVTLGAPSESPLARPQLVDMQGWALLSGDRQAVAHVLRAQAELLHADLRHAPDALAELYWQAPPSYLGDRVSGPGEGARGATSSAGGPGRVDGVRPGHAPLSAPRCPPTAGPSTTSCIRSPSGETCSRPQRAGRTWCYRWLRGGGGQVGRAEPGRWAARDHAHACLPRATR